ncbi:sugar phosphate isomerase/epimerase family protein [Cellulomonas fengjieae]|uniref:Sugar phosphate isomerase/epimerase n=1 Tax=Cellulomonas fengjieae TaxID=2819978 RepID=A0ABS3SCH6_9CELL|nr:sugar phosphate isomerase/epimerase family protein [Cellulomonas fengjieae]MBO3083219.1 sugar phosphate isomerase/epimerase [Cellulomonas fengjieae]QVI65424.1 sugar phosphate isomerase/epimerase [Cellulomonas fengjieae]
MSADLSRLSLNTATTKAWTLREAVDGAVRAGLPAIGLWRDRVQEAGLAEAAKIVADAGLRVSSLCRGGFLTADDDAAARAALDDNRRAIAEAATLGTRELIMVVGGLPGGVDLVGARRRVADRIGELAPSAAEHGVRLVLEPLHPMFVADRAVISTLGQALDIAEPFPADVVGVVVDTYHVWWDPDLQHQIARAGVAGRIAGYQVCDWVLPLAADALLSRGHVGDGYIDVPTITGWVAQAGYTGDVEVEIFNQAIWDTPGDETLATLTERYVGHVLPHL